MLSKLKIIIIKNKNEKKKEILEKNIESNWNLRM